MLAASCLVQSIYVLGDYCGEFSRFFKFGKLTVCSIRLYSGDNELFTVKTVEFCSMRIEKTGTENFFRRPVPFLVVQSVNTAKIGDSTFCGNSCTAKEDDSAAFVNILLKFSRLFFCFHYTFTVPQRTQEFYLLCRYLKSHTFWERVTFIT